MAKVIVRKNYTGKSTNVAANFEQAMKLFKRRVAEDGIMAELRKREYYMKPGIKKRKKREAARILRDKKSK